MKKGTYSEGFLFEARVLGDETHAETGTMKVRCAFGRVHPARTDVADVFACAGDGNSTTCGSAHRRGGGCSGGGGGSGQGFISDHGRIAPTGESVNAAEILRRSSTNADQRRNCTRMELMKKKATADMTKTHLVLPKLDATLRLVRRMYSPLSPTVSLSSEPLHVLTTTWRPNFLSSEQTRDDI